MIKTIISVDGRYNQKNSYEQLYSVEFYLEILKANSVFGGKFREMLVETQE